MALRLRNEGTVRRGDKRGRKSERLTSSGYPEGGGARAKNGKEDVRSRASGNQKRNKEREKIQAQSATKKKRSEGKRTTREVWLGVGYQKKKKMGNRQMKRSTG